MSNLDLVHGALKTVMDVLAPFIWGFAVAYLLDAPVRWFEKKLGGRRMLSILISYLLAVAVLVLLLSFVIPQLVQSVSMLINNASSYLDNLNGVVNDWGDRLNIDPEVISGMMLSYTDLMNKATVLVTAFIPQILNYGMAVGSGVVSALTAFIASVYMLMDKHKLLSQLHKITYAFLPLPKARRVLTVCSHANQVFSGFIIGKIIDSAIIGVICFVGMSVLGMPFTLLISMIVGVTNVIPFFGPFIGAIPSIMILLMASPIDAIKFAIFVLALQQFDGNILGPKILGDSTGLSAIWVLVAIIVGGGLFGFAGMVVGVPTFAVLYSLTSDFLADRLKAKGITANGEPLEPESAVPSEETLPENQ
ncbi:hypothetical protein B5G03_12820 [Gemmiger sp. An50]|nr:hypothetical protein B5G03_12820 [Gemmiger sp. An50]